MHEKVIDAIDAADNVLIELSEFLKSVRDGVIPADNDSINAMLALIYDCQDRFMNSADEIYED